MNKNVVMMLAIRAGLFGQAAGPAFEAATIQPAPPITPAVAASGKLHVGTKIGQAYVDIGYTSLAELICTAYEVKSFQISGPDWMGVQRWDILARLPEGAAAGQVPRMLQTLLEERFGLKLHRETRQRQVYALVIGKGGAKLQAPPDETSAPDSTPRSELSVDTSRDGKSTVVTGGGYGTTHTEMRPDGSMHLESSRMTLALLAESVAYYLDRPVVDLTRLQGGYRMELDLSAADLRFAAVKAGAPGYAPPPSDGAAEPSGASLVASIQKMGLRLEPQEAPLDVIVIDHLERTPSSN